MPSSPSIEYARNGDVSIAYSVDGEGPVDLLFVTGFVSNLDVALTHPVAQPFWERLRSFARVVCFDKRGQGLSDRGPYTIEDVAADAIAVLDAVGIERASILGVSEGGTASMMLAATYPERVASIAQYATYARIARSDDFPEGIPVERLERTWERLEEGWAERGSLELFAPSAADDPELADFWARMLRSGISPSTRRTLGEMYSSLDVRPLLAGVKAPTLLLWREGDRLIPPRLTKAVAAGVAESTTAELPGSDHLFLSGDTGAMLDRIEEFLTGRPATRAPDRVLATVLLVDVVDSTHRASELGDRAWRETLTACESRWRHEVSQEGGTFVKSTGDGFLATFEGPSRAARAALAACEAAAGAGVTTRAGIHTGECEMARDDIAGMAVHIAARVESEAAPGTVAATATVRDLSIGSGLRFDEIGERSLKGVPGSWPLYAVAAS